MQPVLLEAAHSHRSDSAPDPKRLADQRAEALHDAARDQSRENQMGIAKKGTRRDPGHFAVEPVRHDQGLGHQALQRLRRFDWHFIGTLKRSSQKGIDLLGRQEGEVSRCHLPCRIADGGVTDIGFRQRGIDLAGRLVALRVCGGDLHPSAPCLAVATAPTPVAPIGLRHDEPGRHSE